MLSDPFRLPEPPAEALARSAALAGRIGEEIDASADGAIPFSRYMELALYAPGLGYYSGGATKLGPAGDFTTAPETSALFGRCFARQLAEVFDALGGGEVLELGAGTGALAAAALEEFDRMGRPAPAWRILEPSPELAERQQARLGSRADWTGTLPGGFEGVILANEVADALPVERFRLRGGRVLRLGVGRRPGGFGWVERPAPPELRDRVRRTLGDSLAALPDGYTSEISPVLEAWVGSLADSLARGLVLLADYGLPRREYYAPERDSGTLVCHYRHRVHADPFLWPGLQDLSAWVDFTTVAEAGAASGLTLEGFTTQAAFLAANGLAAMVAEEPDDGRRARLANEARQLTLPGEMGERFRFIGLSRDFAPPLSGFGLVDLAGRL